MRADGSGSNRWCIRLSGLSIGLTLLAGCITTASNSPLPETSYTAAEQAALEEPVRLLNGKTTWSWDPGHGTQLEYLAPDGTAHLWYPGNRVVLHGRWMLVIDETNIEDTWRRRSNSASASGPRYIPSVQVCYNYGRNTYNPVTRQSGDRFQCEWYKAKIVSSFDTADGDIFRLAKRETVPFVMEKPRKYEFDEVKTLAGVE